MRGWRADHGHVSWLAAGDDFLVSIRHVDVDVVDGGMCKREGGADGKGDVRRRT